MSRLKELHKEWARLNEEVSKVKAEIEEESKPKTLEQCNAAIKVLKQENEKLAKERTSLSKQLSQLQIKFESLERTVENLRKPARYNPPQIHPWDIGKPWQFGESPSNTGDFPPNNWFTICKNSRTGNQIMSDGT